MNHRVNKGFLDSLSDGDRRVAEADAQMLAWCERGITCQARGPALLIGPDDRMTDADREIAKRLQSELLTLARDGMWGGCYTCGMVPAHYRTNDGRRWCWQHDPVQRTRAKPGEGGQAWQ